MTEKIKQFIQKKWETLPISAQHKLPKEDILISKFYHGQASQNSKVLFLATYGGVPICIIKTLRSALANGRLKREKEAQGKFVQIGGFCAPRVYFDGTIDARYLYAEEVVSGEPFPVILAREKEKEIVRAISSFPAAGSILTVDIAKIFSDNLLPEDAEVFDLIKYLERAGLSLKKGFSHGDLTRKNIINSYGNLYLIDWERAGERPFWLIDAVHFAVGLKDIKNRKEWEQYGASLLAEYAEIDEGVTVALYCVESALEIFCKKYPVQYPAVVSQLARL